MTDRTPHGTHHRDEIIDLQSLIGEIAVLDQTTPVPAQPASVPAPEGHEPAESEFA